MKWFFSRVSRKGTPLPISVSNRITRGLRFRERARPVEGVEHRGQVVAVDALHVPAEGGPLVGQRLEAEHLARRAVGLLVVDVDQADQVVEPVVRGAHRRLPGRALVELAVGHRVVDEGRVLLLLQPQRHADADRQALAERAAGDLHARRVGGHARHRQAAVVAAVGLELALGNDAGLDQRRVVRDRIVAVRQQEAVAAFPFGFVGAVVHRMAVGHGQHVGPAERLADVALALHLAHAQRVAADAVGGLHQLGGCTHRGLLEKVGRPVTSRCWPAHRTRGPVRRRPRDRRARVRAPSGRP